MYRGGVPGNMDPGVAARRVRNVGKSAIVVREGYVSARRNWKVAMRTSAICETVRIIFAKES